MICLCVVVSVWLDGWVIFLDCMGGCFRLNFSYFHRFRHISIRIGSFLISCKFVFVFMFELAFFNFIFILKCKSENNNKVILIDTDRFQP
jgi:hypothetical protein